ncbi:hypothetical protein HKD37_07G019719 [Glycine soja]
MAHMFAFFWWKKPGGPFGPTTFIRRPMNSLPSIIHVSSTNESAAPRIYCLSPMNLLPSAVHVSSTIESGAPRIYCLALPMNSLPSTVHVSSTNDSGAPRIYCLALFANSPFSTIIRSPMNLLPSTVHVSSTIESGAPRIYCLALFANSPFSTFIRRPMNSLPSAVHVSSTNESGAPRIYCLAMFANSPFSTFIRRPMNALPSTVHVSSTHESGTPRIYCLVLFANSPFSTFNRSPMNLLPSAVHVSSTIESGAPRIYCLALFANSPFSTFIRRPMNSLPSAVHVSFVIKRGASSDWEICFLLFSGSQSGPLGPSSFFLQKAVASGGSNLARLGELGGKLLLYFAINRGRSEKEKGFSLLGTSYSLEIAEENCFREENSSRGASDLMILHNLNPRLLLGGLLLRQKGSTECGYYVMHWMSTIILGSFRNNLETVIVYFKQIRPLEAERFKALRIQIMASPPASPTPPLPSPPPSDSSPLSSIVKQTRKASRLRSLSTRPPGAERPVVHVDPGTGKADGPHRKKLRTYLGIVARDKVDVTYENWKEAEFEIPEASDSRTKKKLLQTVGKRWRQFKSNLTRKWALAADQDGVDDTVCEKYGISKEKWAQFCQTRRDPSWEDVRKKAQAIQKQNTAPHNLLAEKTKKKLEEAAQSGSVDGVIDPPSPVKRHDSFEEQATQGSFVPHGRQDVLTAAIGRLEHPGRVRVAGAAILWIGSTDVPQLFLTASRRIAAANPANQGPARGVDHIKSDSATHGIGLTLPPEPPVGPSGPRVSTKGSYVDPSGNDPEMGDSDMCGLYIKANPTCLGALGRVYEGSTVVHNTLLLPGQVKVGVEEVKDPDAPVPIPTDEVSLVGQAIHTFLSWPTHLVKSLSQQTVVSPAKPPQKSDPEVDDPLYLMTLTIPKLFLRPYQVTWDATVFGVFNLDFPLYIKHEDLFEITHGGQCHNISVLQLWIMHLTDTSMRAGNSDIYGFLKPQSIQRSGQSQFEIESYIKSWIRHWQMVVIGPKEHLVVWFCSLHNRSDNYLKGIINSAIKGLDDAPQPKSKAPARWIVVKPERLKVLRIQWAQYYLRVRAES